MRCGIPKSCFFSTLVFILFVSLPTFLLAGQEVRIFVEADEAGDSEPRPSALLRALAQGVSQEADVLLQGSLDDERRAALQRILEPRAEEYVLGWEEIEYLPTDWGAVLHLNVRVNREALRNFLRSLGVTSTQGRQVDYQLDPQGLTSAQLEVVRSLERLSGVLDDGSDTLILRLGVLEGGWQGVLDYEGMVWTAAERDLPGLWASLWEHYFRLDRARGGFEGAVTLVTQGWRSTGDIQAFDLHLRALDVSMDAIDLLGVSMQADRYQANWRVVTLDRDTLTNRVRHYLQERSVTFDLE